jgi:hydrogenase maturation factor
LEIHLDHIPILPLSERIGALLGIDPLGLIGSGTLLIVCRADSTQRLAQALGEGGIKAACIGRVTEPGRGVRAYRNGEAVAWPHFAVDEITRLFS